MSLLVYVAVALMAAFWAVGAALAFDAGNLPVGVFCAAVFLGFMVLIAQHLRPRLRRASYADLVDAETRALAAEEELIAQRAEAQKHVRALLNAERRSQEVRVRERDAALEWLHDGQPATPVEDTPTPLGWEERG